MSKKQNFLREVATQDFYDEMFENLLLYFDHYRYWNSVKDDWESFKDWAIKQPLPTNQLRDWCVAWTGHDLWKKWNYIQEEKEKTELEKTFAYTKKKHLCRVCGREKTKEQFFHLDSHSVKGKRTEITVYEGTGLCTDCYEAIRTEQKRKSEEHRKELRKQWYQAHKEEIAAKQKENRAARRESNQKYAKTHREHINQHIAERKQNDPVYKLKCQARKTIYMSFARTGNIKQEKCENLTGLPLDAFVEHLLSTYQKNYGIPWDGKEAVHVDHIIPLATANTEEDVIRLCHYTNLQLLTASDNIKKGDKLYANN